MKTPVQPPRSTADRWLYRLGCGGDTAVRHAIRRDLHQLAECGARGPFYPRAAGNTKDCHICKQIVKEFFPKEALESQPLNHPTSTV